MALFDFYHFLADVGHMKIRENATSRRLSFLNECIQKWDYAIENGGHAPHKVRVLETQVATLREVEEAIIERWQQKKSRVKRMASCEDANWFGTSLADGVNLH